MSEHELKQWDCQKLFDYVYNALEKEKNLGLRKIDDWSIKENASCECEDCSTLNEFL